MEKLLNQFRCDQCDCTFKNESTLKDHLQCHDKSYVCKICNAQFNHVGCLHIHAKLHV